VLHIKSADDLRALLQDTQLTTEQQKMFDQWLLRLCARHTDRTIRLPHDDCSGLWYIGAVLGDGHVRADDGGDPFSVTHYMQVRRPASNSAEM
jgi:hypothetical protein